MTSLHAACLISCMGLSLTWGAHADDLYQQHSWANVAGDQKAAHIGDILTVVVYQNARSSNEAHNDANKRSNLDGALHAGSTDESGQFSLNGAYSGQGQTSRTETLVTQISVVIEEVMPNGDYAIAGQQNMHVNGENTTIRVRGRVRPVDISSDNEVLSTRIADAQIDYGGRGFVSRNAGPGPIQRLFGLLGLGG